MYTYLKTLLGYFWNTVIDQYFMKFCYSMYCVLYMLLIKITSYCTNIFCQSKYLKTAQSGITYIPLYINIQLIHRRIATLDEILSATDPKAIGSESDQQGYVIDNAPDLTHVSMLSDHSTKQSIVLIKDKDFSYKEGKLFTYIDLRELPFEKVTRVVEGLPITYLVLYGNDSANTYSKNIFIENNYNKLLPYTPILWRIKQLGCSYLHLKTLLAFCNQSVIAQEDGVITASWSEYGYTCILINSNIYVSEKQCNFTLGDTIHQCDTLFGDLLITNTLDAITSTAVPGITVMTDAGYLYAENSSKQALVYSGKNILPLTGDNIDDYKDICAAREADSYIIPDTVNPAKYITDTIRSGTSIIVSIKGVADQALLDVLYPTIKTYIPASTILTICNIIETQDITIPVDITTTITTA